MIELLKIREMICRSSTAKYQAFELRSRSDGRARDNTIFFGAHTGRQSGTGLQPQNLFKRIYEQEDVEAGLKLMLSRDALSIQALFDKPMDLYASALRSCIIAADGCTLDVGDWNAIEVRVLFWLAGHTKGLQAFRDDRDLYLEMAAHIYGMKIEKLVKLFKAGQALAKLMRQLGKQTVLGAGFGIGINGIKFQATCAQYKIKISLELAQSAIKAYRAMHPQIPAFWRALEKAAIYAVVSPGRQYRVGRLVWEKRGDFLQVTLPIGRKICYYKARVDKVKTPYGMKPQLSYMGVRSPSKTFGLIHTWGGKLAENVTQGVARDLMVEAELRLEKTRIYQPVLAVHDEIISERWEHQGSNEEFLEIIGEAPAWADDLPIKVEGWSEKRYRK